MRETATITANRGDFSGLWTDKTLKEIEPRDRRYRQSEGTGRRGLGRLVIDVQPNGVKTFFFQYYRHRNGKSLRTYIQIGRYKETARIPGFTLSEARDEADKYIDLLKKGTDPKFYLEEQQRLEDERHRQRELKKSLGTFGQLLDAYIQNMETTGKRSFKSTDRSLDIYVREPFPELIKRKANEITTEDLRMVLSRMIEKGITTHTNRVRSYLHAAFQFGLKQDNDPENYLDTGTRYQLSVNPVAFIPKKAKFEQVGEHVITEGEIRLIWEKLPKESILAGKAVQLAFTTGQRAGELIRLEWQHVDFNDKTLLIPTTVSKNKRDHLVPLDDLSLSILEDLHDRTQEYDFIFPSANRWGYLKANHFNISTLAKFIRQVCSNEKDIDSFKSKDIRRTVKTLMGKAGISKMLRDRIQNHAFQDVSSKHYDRYDYLPEKRQAMKVWNDYLDLIIHPDNKVSHISKRKVK